MWLIISIHSYHTGLILGNRPHPLGGKWRLNFTIWVSTQEKIQWQGKLNLTVHVVSCGCSGALVVGIQAQAKMDVLHGVCMYGTCACTHNMYMSMAWLFIQSVNADIIGHPNLTQKCMLWRKILSMDLNIMAVLWLQLRHYFYVHASVEQTWWYNLWFGLLPWLSVWARFF